MKREHLMQVRLQQLATHKVMCAKPDVQGFDALVFSDLATSQWRGRFLYYRITPSGQELANHLRESV